MKLESLNELFIDELEDLYSAENMIIKALPKMIEKVASPQLKSALSNHLKETEGQVVRLDKIFDELEEQNDDVDRTDKKCKGIEGIIKENEELLKEDAEPDVRDAGIIAGAQRVEHYEIAAYGTVRTYANLLGHNEWARLLEETLNEEKSADEKLNMLSTSINLDAKAA